MATHPPALDVELCNLKSDSFWKEAYPLLQSFARRLVYTSHVPSWAGQESEVIEDIVQETCRRIIERSQKVDRGEAAPVQSLKNMLLAISHNYCEDLRRRDRRQLRTQHQDTLFREPREWMASASLAEVGTENAYNEVLFRLVAREVAAFPNKQRRAILIDLACRMHFGKQSTGLQQAFLDADIDLREYARALPSNPRDKNRHVALVNHAYKRLAYLQQVQRYIAFT